MQILNTLLSNSQKMCWEIVIKLPLYIKPMSHHVVCNIKKQVVFNDQHTYN